MNLNNFIQSRKKAKSPARINLRNIYAVLQAWVRKLRGKGASFMMSGMALPQFYWEQVIWRRVQLMNKSPKCWQSGACINCGCEVLGKTMEDRACEWGCYPKLMNEPNWQAYKRIHAINLFD